MVVETGGKGSKAYMFQAFWDFTCTFGLFVPGGPSWGGQSKGNQNQLYLIRVGEERKQGNRNERRREGKRPTVSNTVGFDYL